MGKLFVMLFDFAPALITNLHWFLHPDTPTCPKLKTLPWQIAGPLANIETKNYIII
jgi:hypothetical protein